MDDAVTDNDQPEITEEQDHSQDEPAVITLKSRDVSVVVSDDSVQKQSRNGGVPVTPAPHPDEPFLERYKWWVLGGAIAAAVLAIGLVAFLFLSDSSKSQSADVLLEPARRVDAINADIGNTTSIAGFNRAGDRVGRVQTELSGAQQQAQLIDNDEVRAATLGLLAAEDQLMTAYDDLASIHNPGSSASRDIYEDAKDAKRQIITTIDRLKVIGLEEAPSPYPNSRNLDRAVKSLKVQLGG